MRVPEDQTRDWCVCSHCLEYTVRNICPHASKNLVVQSCTWVSKGEKDRTSFCFLRSPHGKRGGSPSKLELVEPQQGWNYCLTRAGFSNHQVSKLPVSPAFLWQEASLEQLSPANKTED